MVRSFPIYRAARILRSGGIVAYPTEGVFGLGCLPSHVDAVVRLLAIKQRDAASGLILIASDFGQLEPWTTLLDGKGLSSSPEHPITWVVPAKSDVPYVIRGDHDGLAVRITTHPVAAALCTAADSALVSTSANLAGRAPARTAYVLRRLFGRLVDCIVPGRCGPAKGPSEIRDWKTGKVLRAATA